MDIKTRRIELPHGMTLHLREGGEGKQTTLLIHGWAVPGVVWEPVLSRWPESAGRVLAPDLRGTGWSEKPREGYTLEDDVKDVVALIVALALTDLVLVGHSKGGAIVQRVALERPAALRKLILLCPVPASGVAFDEGTAGYFRSLCGHRDGAAQLIGAMLAMKPEPALLERLVESMSSVGLESLLGGFEAFRNANFGDQVSAIRTPTVVISGGAETVLSPALMQEKIVNVIPGSRLRLLEGSGHYPQIECPDVLMGALLEEMVG